jgi:hypothetical protein
MNYLNFKNLYPHSLNKFFYWVARQDPQEQGGYVDNAYFYKFFWDIFDYRPSFGITITDKRYLEFLKPLLIQNKQIDNDYWANQSKILIGKYSDTGQEFIQIRFNEENDYENAFYVLEALINEGLYA